MHKPISKHMFLFFLYLSLSLSHILGAYLDYIAIGPDFRDQLSSMMFGEARKWPAVSPTTLQDAPLI